MLAAISLIPRFQLVLLAFEVHTVNAEERPTASIV